MESIRDKVAIIGAGCTKFGERWDVGLHDLAIDAAYEAYEDAGIGPEDIQACFLGTSTAPVLGTGAVLVPDALKLRDIPIIRNENFPNFEYSEEKAETNEKDLADAEAKLEQAKKLQEEADGIREQMGF